MFLQIISIGFGPDQCWPILILWAGSGTLQKKNKKDYSGPRSAHPFSGLSSAQPMYIYYIYLFIIIYNTIKKNEKFQKSFEKIVIFSNIFLPILHNIGLYIYTVKYKSDIKIPGFLQNISKKKIQSIFKKKKIFCCIRSNPKIFPSIFFIKKKTSFSCLKKSKWIS
jgi:hypothetical protein